MTHAGGIFATGGSVASCSEGGRVRNAVPTTGIIKWIVADKAGDRRVIAGFVDHAERRE